MTLRDPLMSLEARFVRMKGNAVIAIKPQLVEAMKSWTLASSKLCDVPKRAGR